MSTSSSSSPSIPPPPRPHPALNPLQGNEEKNKEDINFPTTTTPLFIAISGLTSSGKTTISRLLREIFTFQTTATTTGDNDNITNADIEIDIQSEILHQDDFFVEEEKLPVVRYWYDEERDRVVYFPGDGENSCGSNNYRDGEEKKKRGLIEMEVRDWDCVSAINFDNDVDGGDDRGCEYCNGLKKLDITTASSTEELSSKQSLPSLRTTTSTTTIPSMKSTLHQIKFHTTNPNNPLLPPWLTHFSKETQNTTGPSYITPTFLSQLKSQTIKTISSSISISSPTKQKKKNLKILFIDGFLLYHKHSPLLPFFDKKLLLQTPFAKAKQRRRDRDGYVTLEGFWKDPEGYFEAVVWTNYLRNYGYLFVGGGDRSSCGDGGQKKQQEEQGDICKDPEIDVEVVERLGIDVLPRRDMSAEEGLAWAVQSVLGAVEEKIREMGT